MHKRKLAREFRLPTCISAVRQDPELQLLTMVCNISVQFQENPVVVREGTKSLWIYYENSYFPCELLLDELGTALAEVSRRYPTAVYGNTRHMETAKITVVYSGEEILVRKYDVSGKDFQELCGIGIRVQAEEAAGDLLFEIIREVRYDGKYLAYTRSREIEGVFEECGQLHPDSYYRYIPLTSEESLAAAAASLPLEYKKKLWLLLLGDGMSAVEFEAVLGAYERQELADVFSWDLALRLALEEAGITISYDNNDFRIAGGGRERIRYNYEKGSAAQRLLLKLLFPVPSL